MATGQHLSAGETSDEAGPVAPLDKVSSADIAVNVARTVGLPETNSVTNHADSVNAASAAVEADSAVVAKPQVMSSGLPSKDDIQTYVTKQGDTISSIASKMGVSSDSVRWSNGLTGDTVAVGITLVLPPSGVNGIVHTVGAGETPESLAQKFKADKALIISFNDAEVSGLKVGERILIPNGVLTATATAATATTGYSTATNFAWGNSPIYSANGYDYGWCTWWAAKRRADIGKPIPSNLGNAITWSSVAAGVGFTVDTNPSVGAVAYYRTIGGAGHVGFVERVDSGGIWISDMNYFGVSQIGGSASTGGWNVVSYHRVTPDQYAQYYFIH